LQLQSHNLKVVWVLVQQKLGSSFKLPFPNSTFKLEFFIWLFDLGYIEHLPWDFGGWQ
jgi:hypothetical protein